MIQNILKKKKKLLNFFSNKEYSSKIEVNIISLKNYLIDNKIKKIDLLKIDTEGFEFDVLSGLEEEIKKIKFIFFEHHYDDMYKKNYIHIYKKIVRIRTLQLLGY